MNNLFPEKYATFISELSIIASFLGLILSAIGLWLSILVLKEAKIFKKFILSKVRVPDLEKSLSDIYEKINNSIQDDIINNQRVLELLSQAKVYTQSVLDKTQENKMVQEQCRIFLKDLDINFSNQTLTKSEIRDKLIKLSALVASISEYNKDSYLR